MPVGAIRRAFLGLRQFPPFPKTNMQTISLIVQNEEGRNLGLPINRIINERMDICGDFFLCGHDGAGLSDMPEDLIDKYRNVFSIKATDRTSQAWPMPT